MSRAHHDGRGPSRPARRVLACAASAVLACLLAGCLGETQDRSSLVHPRCNGPFRECPVNLGAYKSVQLRPGGQDPNLALAVAVSGGGHRAGNFGAGVLMGLEEITAGSSPQANVLREVDYLSTVSGGGLAAAAYVASLHDHLAFGGAHAEYSFRAALRDPSAKPPDVGRQRTDPNLRKHLEYAYVWDIVRGFFSAATLGKLHRGDFLEESFDDHVLGYRWRTEKLKSAKGGAPRSGASLTLGDVFIRADDPRRTVKLPYWVANATVYENGAIFAFTPDHLGLYRITGYVHRLKKIEHDEKKESYRQFLDDVPLSLGLTASGNFPVAIPARTLDSKLDGNNPYLHVLDGGMAENLGVITALRLLRKEPHGAVARRALIVIDAYNGPLNPFSNRKEAPLMVATAFRTTTAYMDSWRGRSREVVEALCRSASQDIGGDIGVVFLSFEDLLGLKDFQELFKYGFTERDLKELWGKGTLYGARITPFTLVREVWTWYSLSRAEQNLLFAAGRYVVHKKRDQILEALGCQPAATGK